MTTVFLTIIILGFIILVHELGHFIAARRAGILCHEFSIGFGPVLHSWWGGETRFSVRLIPLGGYVLMAGEVPSGPEEDEDDAPYPPAEPGRSFPDKSVLTRMGVIAAGPATNFIAAFVVFFVVLALVGIPAPTVEIAAVAEGLAADRAGVLPGDRVLSIDGVDIERWDDVVMTVRERPNRQVTMTVERDEETVALEMVIGISPQEPGVGYIGIEPELRSERIPILPAVAEAASWTGLMLLMLLEVFLRLFQGETANLLGVVGLGAEVGRAATLGLASVLWMVATISASIGFFQLLPIPALDGSRLVFLIIEAIRGRPMDPEKEGMINFLGFAFLILLVLYVTFQDITRLFG
ncbi:MAG: M50 family metallopeptidase [Bacillota bacterium]